MEQWDEKKSNLRAHVGRLVESLSRACVVVSFQNVCFAVRLQSSFCGLCVRVISFCRVVVK